MSDAGSEDLVEEPVEELVEDLTRSLFWFFLDSEALITLPYLAAWVRRLCDFDQSFVCQKNGAHTSLLLNKRQCFFKISES